METETTDVDDLLQNVGNMLLDEVLIVDVQMDFPEVAATPEEKEHDQLLLIISKHIRMYKSFVPAKGWRDDCGCKRGGLLSGQPSYFCC